MDCISTNVAMSVHWDNYDRDIGSLSRLNIIAQLTRRDSLQILSTFYEYYNKLSTEPESVLNVYNVKGICNVMSYPMYAFYHSRRDGLVAALRCRNSDKALL